MNIKMNLPNFNLEEIDDFDTIDNELLANLVYDNNIPTPKMYNKQ